VAAFFLVPILAGQGGTAADVGVAVLKAAGVVVAVLVLARRLMPPVLERVARTCSPEIFLLAIVSICFGTAWVTSLMGLSLSLGAFLAGLIVSESEFSQHAMMEILPLQILFSATFFVSVGMLVDVSFLFSNLPVILAVVLAVVVVKTVTTGVAVRGLGYAAPVSLMVGVLPLPGGGVRLRPPPGRLGGGAHPRRGRRGWGAHLHRLQCAPDGGHSLPGEGGRRPGGPVGAAAPGGEPGKGGGSRRNAGGGGTAQAADSRRWQTM
jgi:hypothetical protein